MSPSNLFPITFWKFPAICFGCDCYDSKLLEINTNHLLKSVSWRHQMYSKMLRQFSKVLLNFIRVIKHSSFNQSFLLAYLVEPLQTIFLAPCSECLLTLLAAVPIYIVLVLRFLDMKCFSFANVSIPVCFLFFSMLNIYNY